MASAVDICNLALGHLGDEATVSSIDPPEGSAQAEHCQRFYPIALDALLGDHNWTFAIKRKALAALGTPPASWSFSYAFPTDCITALAVISPTDTDATAGNDFEIETLDNGTRVIYTNVEEATLRYVRRITDLTKWSALAATALARLLAAYLAGPVIKGTEGMKVAEAQLKWYRTIDLPRAAAHDANTRSSEAFGTATPAAIAARA